MKKTILTVVITAAFCLGLIGGGHTPVVAAPFQAQDQIDGLVTRTRQWARDAINLDNEGLAITASWNQISSSIASSGGVTWSGTNTGLTKTQMTSVITTIGNLHTTYASGNITNVEVFAKPK